MSAPQTIQIESSSYAMPPLTILGAGPAGLAAGYFARKHHLPAVLFEASEHVGGNCRTLRYGDFLFDTGAHRLHDRYPTVTAEIKRLLGDDLLLIHVPSQIVYRNRFVDFPLSPLNLMRKLGPITTLRATKDFIVARVSHKIQSDSFESIALQNYGRTIAKKFLLDYSEKLWGLPASKLSPAVSGKRLRGLNVGTFLVETFRGSRLKTEHLDGRFYYPKFGIGMIMDKLAESCGYENIHRNSRITKIFHDEKRILRIEINNREHVPVENVISTLPLSILVRNLEPKAPPRILDLVSQIKYQNLILAALFLRRKHVTPNASLYFPDADIPFTRAYEPKNRSPFMAPEEHTSLIVEIPCSSAAALWAMNEKSLIEKISDILIQKHLISPADILDSALYRIPFAYPVLELGFESVIRGINEYLERFANLRILGRSGRFEYTHIHDLMAAGQELIESELPLYSPVQKKQPA